MYHFAVQVYVWGRSAHRRLLGTGLGPWYRALRLAEPELGLWYTFFDARAPHLLAVFSTPDDNVAELKAQLQVLVEAFLEGAPVAVEMTEQEVQKAHDDCRGKALTAADREPGLAEPNTFLIFDHPADGYPFFSFQDDRDAPEILGLWHRIAAWALEHVAGGGAGTAAGIAWLASVDRALAERTALGSTYWRRHACTLLYHLEASLAEDEQRVLDSLPGLISEGNRRIFDRVWAAVEEGDAAVDLADELVSRLLGSPEVGEQEAIARMTLLREMNHVTLQQLLMPVRSHIPVVLYAWNRRLTVPEGPTEAKEASRVVV